MLRVIALADGASVEVEAEPGYPTCAAAGLYGQVAHMAYDFAVENESESAVVAAVAAYFAGDFSEVDG